MADVASGRSGRVERACASREAGRGGPVLPKTALPRCTSGSVRLCPLGLPQHLLQSVHRCALPLSATPNPPCHGGSWRASGSSPAPLCSPPALRMPSRRIPAAQTLSPAAQRHRQKRTPVASGSLARAPDVKPGELTPSEHTPAALPHKMTDRQTVRQTDRQPEAAACRRPAARPRIAFYCAEARGAAAAGERRCLIWDDCAAVRRHTSMLDQETFFGDCAAVVGVPGGRSSGFAPVAEFR